MTAGLRLDFLLSAALGSDYIETTGVVLDALNCRVRAQYRYWDKAWMVSLFLPTGAPVIQGATANHGEDVLSNVVVEGRPPGQLLVYDTSGKERDPGLDDWRAGVWLVYVPAVLL